MTTSPDDSTQAPRCPRAAGRAQTITIIGGGIIGLWQALTLAQAGHTVSLVERSPATAPHSGGASRFGGAMLAPDCEAESAPLLVRDFGREAIALWRAAYPALATCGSLVIAQPRERAELARFALATTRHRQIDQAELARLEPDIGQRFDTALYFAAEAHMSATDALSFLTTAVKQAGVTISYGATILAGGDTTPSEAGSIIIDCRGFAAADDLPTLRGVRGERVIVRCAGLTLNRPVRVLHPRVPLYIVPWPDHTFMIGASVIESCDDSPMSVRSALELLGAAYALHPAFSEAAILDMGAGVRPALPDNIPRAFASCDGRTLWVNGAYRHGFLLAPILAQATLAYLSGEPDHPLLVRM